MLKPPTFHRRSIFVFILGLVTVYSLFTGQLSHMVNTSGKSGRASEVFSPDRKLYPHLSGDGRTVAIAKDIAKEGKPLLISVVNNAFLPLAHSWLCNTEPMDIHEQVMLIVPDVTSRKELEEKWPRIHVVDVAYLSRTKKALNFSTAGYVRMMVYRTKLLNKLLIHNVDFFLFEVDAVWFRNPVSDIKKRLGNNDIAVVLVTTFKDLYAGGLLYMRSTTKTKRLWYELTKQMRRLEESIAQKPDDFKISEAENDQMYLSELLKRKFGHVKLTLLPGDVYADGKWYTDEKRNPNPILVNNNWVVGRDAKITRAIKFGHWFWNMTSRTCDVDLVRDTCKCPG